MAAVEKILLQFEADIQDLKSELAKVKGQLGGVEKQSETTGSKMTNTFKNIGKAIGGAFAIQQVTRFIGEIDELARKAEGIEKAFANIGRPGLLDELRKATKGTVSDLELMQSAVKASNFKIPLDQLGKMFAFAQQRARETGESVDYMVESIVLGVSRKSIPILDNLGFSAARVSEEFAKTGDMATAIGNIIDEDMSNAADMTTDAADASDQLTASIMNLKLELGKELAPALTESRKALEWFLGVAVQGAQILNASVMGVENYAVMVGERLSTDAARGAKAMENFNKFFTEHKSQFTSSKEAAEAYVEVLSKQIREYNRRMATEEAGQDLLKIERDLLAQNIDTIENYIKTLSGDGGFIYSIEYLENKLKTLNDTLLLLPIGSSEFLKVQKEIAKVQAELDSVTKKTKLDLSESLDKLPKMLSNIYDPLSELPTEIERFRAALSLIFGDVENNDEVADFFKGIEVAIEDADDANVEFFENLEKNQDLAKKNAENYRDAQFDIAKSLFSGMSDLNDQQTQRYIDNLQRQLDAGRITQGQFENERASALRKQAKQDKAYSVFRIILDTAVSIMNFLTAKPPNPFGAVAAGVAGAIQSGIAINQPLPAFAKGVVDLKGEGTETSDSIFARLSKGESVVTAKGTRQDKGLFEAANKLMLEDYINANYVLPALKEKQKSEGAMFDDYRLYLSLQNMKSNDSKNTNRIVEAIIRQKDNRRRYWA